MHIQDIIARSLQTSRASFTSNKSSVPVQLQSYLGVFVGYSLGGSP